MFGRHCALNGDLHRLLFDANLPIQFRSKSRLVKTLQLLLLPNVAARLCLVVMAFAAISGCVSAPRLAASRGVIIGRVFADGDTSGLADVIVAVSGARASTRTRTDGTFILRRSATGSGSIKLSRSGYHTFQLPPLNLNSADTIHLTATLASAAVPLAAPRVCAESLLLGPTCHNPLFQGVEPLLIIDGVIMMQDDPSLKNLDTDPKLMPVATINVTNVAEAVRLYGQMARIGIVVVTTRRK